MARRLSRASADDSGPSSVPASLTALLAEAHRGVAEKASSTVAAVSADDPRRPVDLFDAESAALNAHLGAVEAVLYPAAKHRLPQGHQVVGELLRGARAMERAMRLMEGRLYGEVAAQSASVRDLQRELEELFRAHVAAEEDMAAQLDSALSDTDRRRLVASVAAVMRHAPTRPHPFVPHARGLAHVSLWLSSTVDRALDLMDNRLVPRRWSRTRRPHDRLDTYVLGSPTFPVQESGAGAPERAATAEPPVRGVEAAQRGTPERPA
jgi:Hemerythrin HHE cation binding domain